VAARLPWMHRRQQAAGVTALSVIMQLCGTQHWGLIHCLTASLLAGLLAAAAAAVPPAAEL
jgi:hypothetical protein